MEKLSVVPRSTVSLLILKQNDSAVLLNRYDGPHCDFHRVRFILLEFYGPGAGEPLSVRLKFKQANNHTLTVSTFKSLSE